MSIFIQEQYPTIGVEERIALQRALSVMPRSSNRAALERLILRVGFEDWPILISASQAAYVAGPVLREVESSLKLALRAHYDSTRQSLRELSKKLTMPPPYIND
jgi:hypothetical protein